MQNSNEDGIENGEGVNFLSDHDRVQLIGFLPTHKDKWQGGYAGLDGSLYFIPENGYRILKVTPPKLLILDQNHQMKHDDYIIEMM